MVQSYAEKITIEAELFESHQFLCRPCSGHPLLNYGVVHPIQGALLCKKCFCIFALIIGHIHILSNLCCQFSPAMQEADGRLW